MTSLPFSIWSIADLHLSFGIPNKSMDVFGAQWASWTDKIAAAWQELVAPEDLVLIPGDISWAMSLDQAKPDLDWIGALPGTKVMIRGNHDYWWSSKSKIEKILPPSLHIVQNDAFHFHDVAVAGARLWDTPEYTFADYVVMQQREGAKTLARKEEESAEDEKIFARELLRLEMSLKQLKSEARMKIVMTHYPPIGANLEESRVSKMLEHYGVSLCVFGHLHNLRGDSLPFGEKGGVRYALVSCDYLNFRPLKIF